MICLGPEEMGAGMGREWIEGGLKGLGEYAPERHGAHDGWCRRQRATNDSLP